MTVVAAILQAMQEILGLEGLDDQMDLNLWESNLVDSLGFVTLISRIEELIDTKISIRDMKTTDFRCIRSLGDAISRQTGKA